jgi:tripartite-type tricarboxylate transporter receptor subunit TctC
MRRLAQVCLNALVLMLLAAGSAAAQGYPTKPVRLIVPFAAGGDIDPIARVLAERLQKVWNQSVLVETRPGAGGTIGSDFVAKSPADGYTLLMCSAGPVTIAPSLYQSLPYAPDKDLEPVALIGAASVVILVNDSIPVKTYGEFVALAKAKPGTLTFATAGVGSLAHLTTMAYSGDAGVKLVHVPYKGSGPAVQDLLGGHINLSFNPMPSALAALATGKVRPLAVTSAKRSQLLPEVATLSELGVTGFDVVSWYGICAPRGTPKDVALKINQAINAAVSAPDVQEQLRKLGTETRAATIDEFAALIRTDAARWSKVIKENNIQLN